MKGYQNAVTKFGGAAVLTNPDIPLTELGVDMTDYEKSLKSGYNFMGVETKQPMVKKIDNFDDMLFASKQTYSPEQFMGAGWMGEA